MAKKLLLINVVDFFDYPDNENYNPLPRITAYEPIHLGIIAAITPNDWQIELIDENFQEFDFVEADLVALSSYSTSINRAYYISSVYRNKNIPVVIGGVHASFFPEEAKNYVDTVAVGKAEGCWAQIIEDFNNNCLKPIYYSNDDCALHFKPFRKIYEKYTYPIATVISSLGCPHSCSFCDIPIINKKKYHIRDIYNIVEELKEIKQEFFIFNDDNFIGNTDEHKDRVKDLLNLMISKKIKKKWMCVTSINTASYPEILSLAAKAGCVMMFIGIESFQNEDLKFLNKSFISKHQNDNFCYAFKEIHKNRIAITGGFMCGFDNHPIGSIITKKNQIVKSKVDSFTYTFFTPLPKTKIYDKLDNENRLLYKNYPKDWIYYNLSCVTFKTVGETYHNYYKTYMQAVIELHSTKVFIKKFFYAIIKLRSIRRALDAYFILSNFHNNVAKIRFFNFLFTIFRY